MVAAMHFLQIKANQYTCQKNKRNTLYLYLSAPAVELAGGYLRSLDEDAESPFSMV